MSKENLYYIKLINTRNGERGFVQEDGKGEIIIADQFNLATKQFPTYQDAQKYIRDKKLERKGMTAHIRDNDDLMKEAAMPNSSIKNMKRVDEHQEVYVVVNEVGQRCFFDSQKGYYFKDGEVGSVCFFSIQQVDEFFTKVKFPHEVRPLKLENKK